MKKTSGGYIAVLILFVGVAILVFLMAQQYERIGVRQRDMLKQESSSGQGGDTVPAPIYPIDRALDAKAAIEARDRAMMGQ